MNPTEQIVANLARRQRAEKRFRAYGLTAIILGMSFLLLLFGSIISNGYKAFTQTYVELPIYFDPEVIDPAGLRDHQALFSADYWKLVKTAMYQKFPQVSGRTERRELTRIVSQGSAYDLRGQVLDDPRPDRNHAARLAGGRRRHRHADEGLHRPGRAGRRPAPE